MAQPIVYFISKMKMTDKGSPAGQKSGGGARVRQLDVAAAAGVSRMTVSLALRGSPTLPVKTRERIQKLADAMGYRADPGLASLAAYRRRGRPQAFHGTLAWLNLTEDPNAHRTWPTLKVFFDAALECAAAYGYHLEVVWAKERDMTPERIAKILYARSTRGVLIQPQAEKPEHMEIDFSYLSVVRLGDYTTLPEGYDLVVADYRWAMSTCMAEVASRGYRCVGYLSQHPFEERLNRIYLSTYLGRMTDTAVHWLAPFFPQNQKQFTAWYKKYRPDALLLPHCCQLLPSLWKWIDHLRIRIPQDMGVCFTCQPDDTSKDWSGVDECHSHIARRGIEILVAHINRYEMGKPDHPAVHSIQGVWREGSTLPPR